MKDEIDLPRTIFSPYLSIILRANMILVSVYYHQNIILYTMQFLGIITIIFNFYDLEYESFI